MQQATVNITDFILSIYICVYSGDADFTTDARFAMSKVLLNRRRRMLPTPGNKRPCYTTFFVGNQPPTGFRTNDATNIIYICQQLPDDANPVKTTYYASMFDVTYGISIFSAYVVTAANAAKVGNYKRNDYNIKWRGTQEPGNCNQETRVKREVLSMGGYRGYRGVLYTAINRADFVSW